MRERSFAADCSQSCARYDRLLLGSTFVIGSVQQHTTEEGNGASPDRGRFQFLRNGQSSSKGLQQVKARAYM